MADQDKPQEQTQPAPPVQEPEQKPTATESAPAPAPAPEPVPEPTTTATTEATATAPSAAPAATTEPTPEATATADKAAPTEDATEDTTPSKPDYLTKTPALSELFDRLPTILSTTGHNEMWGVDLKHDAADIPTVNVLIKFLRANGGDAKLAEDQLSKALQWRKEMDPLALVDSTGYDGKKFGGLGYLTTYPREGERDLVVTWNIYGAVKDIEATFGDIDEFIKWRVALMELAVRELKMDQATSVIDYAGEDPYQMIQVHDYLNVSFFRLNPSIRAATKKTIEVFSTAYPELLREKFFVNVPAIMGWMFALVKVFVNQNTTRKFHPISNGANLAKEFPGFSEKFPKPYGGDGPELEGSARTVSLNTE